VRICSCNFSLACVRSFGLLLLHRRFFFPNLKGSQSKIFLRFVHPVDPRAGVSRSLWALFSSESLSPLATLCDDPSRVVPHRLLGHARDFFLAHFLRYPICLSRPLCFFDPLPPYCVYLSFSVIDKVRFRLFKLDFSCDRADARVCFYTSFPELICV